MIRSAAPITLRVPHQFSEAHAGPVHSALDGADSRVADRRNFLVGQALSGNQQQGLSLFGHQLVERCLQIVDLKFMDLLGSALQPVRVAPVRVLDLASALAKFRVEVGQDRKEPGVELCARRKAVPSSRLEGPSPE